MTMIAKKRAAKKPKSDQPTTLITYAHEEPLDAVMYVRVSSNESLRVKAAAKSQGLTVAAFVRKLTLDWLNKHTA